ncbi:MAG: hypothetical protein ACR2OM_06720 [Aestuariivirgaceae bacterium]
MALVHLRGLDGRADALSSRAVQHDRTPEGALIQFQETVDLMTPARKATAPITDIFGLSHAALVGSRKDNEAYRARAAGMWAAFEAGETLAKIQRRYNRDWGPVKDAIRWCERKQTTDMGYRRNCGRLLEAVKC